MTTVFLVCAAIGGTILIFQFVLSLLGFLDLGVELVEDLDLDGDVGHASHGLEWLWSFISFRTLTAGLTFFGLVGMAVRSMGAGETLQVTSALVAGLAGIYGVNALMQGMMRLKRNGSLRIDKAVGEIATVYLPVPAAHGGAGKVHVVVQGRLEEFQAITPWHDKLPAGAKVVVVGVVDGDTLAVEPADSRQENPPKLAESHP